MSEIMTDKLIWLNELKEESKLLKKQQETLEKEILELAKETDLTQAVSSRRFAYGGRHYEASLNVGRIANRAPNQQAVLNIIRNLLPPEDRTEVAALKLYDSHREQKPVVDSVTIREVNPPETEE